jgi:MFS family permease
MASHDSTSSFGTDEEKGVHRDANEQTNNTLVAYKSTVSDAPAPTQKKKDPQVSELEKGPKTAPSAFDPSSFPDGGKDAWLCVLGGFCVLFCSFGWINCIGVFQNYYETELLVGYAPSTIAWIGSLEVFFMFLFGPLIGVLYDNFGPRWLLLFGSVTEVFGLMMTSLSTKYYQLILAQGICASVGASFIFYPAISTVPTWFFKKRGAAFGIVAAGSSLGGVIAPIMVQRLIPEVGFPWAMRITAFMILFLLIIANLTIKSRFPPKRTPVDLMVFIRPLGELRFDLLAFGSFLFFLGMFLPIVSFIILASTYLSSGD